ncbi:hypothetical protein MMC26_005575 [Xylographa opegraphella]|nr:hypothetical protein [Xylographa opegraphella]
MTLEDFEKSLADSQRKEEEDATKSKRRHRGTDDEHRRHHRSHPSTHRSKRPRPSTYSGTPEPEIPHRSHRHHRHHGDPSTTTRDPAADKDERAAVAVEHEDPPLPTTDETPAEHPPGESLKRDAWMEAPTSLAVDYIHRRPHDHAANTSTFVAGKADSEQKLQDRDLSQHHLRTALSNNNNTKEEEEVEESLQKPSRHAVDYTFGDAGAQWRLLKLKAVYRQATEAGRAVEAVALDTYGDLRAFDDAREEELELERRATYGEGYMGKEKPSGELFQERKMDAGLRREGTGGEADGGVGRAPRSEELGEGEAPPVRPTAPLLDQTALNKLKARMMRATLRGAADAAALEAEYTTAAAAAASATQQPAVLVLGPMESRMLAGGGRRGEVSEVGSKRGLVAENADMSVADMVREERRTRGQAGGEGQRFAERIAKDGKFDNDLDYMDENATKLATRVQKSELSLRNTAIADFQKMNRILDSCPLCYHEDTDTPPVAPVVSLATRVYLTLPTEPEISDGGACIVPLQHRINLLECDDDEWEEIRNFMKSLTRMYHDQGRAVIFYENAAVPQRKKHAGMEAVPLPYRLGETAPAFFKEAILSADEEWTQHKKLIDTLANARHGQGKMAFRRSLVKEMPYFHVWFEIDGGLGHIVEDAGRWPKGDLFAREILGGMLDVGPEVVKRQGRWDRGDMRVDGFRKRWRKFDWTRMLTS